MKKTIIFYLSFLFISTTSSFACSCDGFINISLQDYFFADKIFEGKVVKVEINSPKNQALNMISAFFIVTKKIKPQNMQDTLEVTTNKGEAACGLNLEIGDTWLIFATGDINYVSLCSKSIKYTEKEASIFNKRKKFVLEYSQKTKKVSQSITQKVFVNYSHETGKSVFKKKRYKMTGNLINGIQEGIWLKTYKRDTISYAEFKNGLLHGRYIQAFGDGKARVICHYQENIEEGIYEEYNKKNILTLKAKYNQGKYHGLYESFFDTGMPYEKKQYKQGIVVGEVIIYYSTSGKIHFLNYYDESGKPTGVWKTFNERGELIKEEKQN